MLISVLTASRISQETSIDSDDIYLEGKAYTRFLIESAIILILPIPIIFSGLFISHVWTWLMLVMYFIGLTYHEIKSI